MRYVLALLLLVGCYQAPDYDGTRFKCDAEHGCPDGQTCVAGYCTSGGGIDASQLTDAPPGGAGVQCGATTCGATEKCCADFVGSPSCIALAASCPGFAATCDGTEDCSGSPCCEVGQVIACGTTCQNQICRESADCTNASAAMCCFNTTGSFEPWGRCWSACP